MINTTIKFFTDNNFSAGATGIAVSFAGTLLQINNIITDLAGIMGLVTNLFLAIVYIATAIWLITQAINMREGILEKRIIRKKRNGKR